MNIIVNLWRNCSFSRMFILGAADPEMAEIERVLASNGEQYAYALEKGIERVRPGTAYAGYNFQYAVDCNQIGKDETWYLVECKVPVPNDAKVVVLDHHCPGDPGFGRQPEEFMEASTLGQVLNVLGQTPTSEQRLIAAADHCLGAAYQGKCPDVDPDKLMVWRAASRAAFQKRKVEDVLADIERAHKELLAAPEIILEHEHDNVHAQPVTAKDMRRNEPVPELPEAGTRYGIGYVSGPLIGPDKRRKYNCSGTPEQCAAWLRSWAKSACLVDTYGDPQRGIVGGYDCR